MGIRAEVQDIFRDVFDDERLVIADSMSARDIADWDSVAQMELVVALEKHFHVKFNLREAAALDNVGGILSLVQRSLQQKGAGA